MSWLLIGFVILILLFVFFGTRGGIWTSGIVLITMFLLVFIMNLILPNYIDELNVEDTRILQSELNEEKDLNYLLGLLPDSIEQKILQGYTSYDEVMLADEELAQDIANVYSAFGSTIMGIVGLAVALLILRPLSKAYDFVSKFPVFNKIDKWAGGLIGLINGVTAVHMILVGIAFCSATEMGSKLYEMVYQSKVLVAFYENNFLLYLIL